MVRRILEAVTDAIAAPPPSTVDAGSPSPVADGIERPLDPRWVVLQRQVGWIAAAVVFLAGFMVVSLTGLAVLAGAAPLVNLLGLGLFWLVVSGGLAWRAHAWPPLAYRHTAYRVGAIGLDIRRGVVWRRHMAVPRSRVQHTDVSQGPLERTHGLGTLVVYTAGTDHARVDLPGLDHATALRIRDHLLPDEGGDAV